MWTLGTQEGSTGEKLNVKLSSKMTKTPPLSPAWLEAPVQAPGTGQSHAACSQERPAGSVASPGCQSCQPTWPVSLLRGRVPSRAGGPSSEDARAIPGDPTGGLGCPLSCKAEQRARGPGPCPEHRFGPAPGRPGSPPRPSKNWRGGGQLSACSLGF